VSEAAVRAEIVEVGRRLYAKALIAGNEGNISVRTGDTLLMTPAGVCKGFLAPEAIVRTDLQGRALEPGKRVSSEALMHAAVYARRPDARAVVHAHPPTATAFAVAGIPLDRPLTAEAVLTLGPVPVVPYGTPSTADLSSRVAEAICDAHALLLANHGALTVGDSLLRAWERMETLEQLARVTLASRQLGQSHALPPRDVSRLLGLREAAGYPPPSCLECPVRAEAAVKAADGQVVLSRDELVQLLADAVRRFGGGRT
jgi:L-fuculose-phosphate aldolase